MMKYRPRFPTWVFILLHFLGGNWLLRKINTERVVITNRDSTKTGYCYWDTREQGWDEVKKKLVPTGRHTYTK